jgi:hypothetical protein
MSRACLFNLTGTDLFAGRCRRDGIDSDVASKPPSHVLSARRFCLLLRCPVGGSAATTLVTFAVCLCARSTNQHPSLAQSRAVRGAAVLWLAWLNCQVIRSSAPPGRLHSSPEDGVKGCGEGWSCLACLSGLTSLFIC